jgi:hypothetical protein
MAMMMMMMMMVSYIHMYIMLHTRALRECLLYVGSIPAVRTL